MSLSCSYDFVSLSKWKMKVGPTYLLSYALLFWRNSWSNTPCLSWTPMYLACYNLLAWSSCWIRNPSWKLAPCLLWSTLTMWFLYLDFSKYGYNTFLTFESTLLHYAWSTWICESRLSLHLGMLCLIAKILFAATS